MCASISGVRICDWLQGFQFVLKKICCFSNLVLYFKALHVPIFFVTVSGCSSTPLCIHCETGRHAWLISDPLPCSFVLRALPPPPGFGQGTPQTPLMEDVSWRRAAQKDLKDFWRLEQFSVLVLRAPAPGSTARSGSSQPGLGPKTRTTGLERKKLDAQTSRLARRIELVPGSAIFGGSKKWLKARAQSLPGSSRACR